MPNSQTAEGPSQTEPRFIRVEVHLDPLIDEAHRFITMKWPRANPRESLGDFRYGYAILPMDEALAEAAIDISGRPFLAWSVPFARDKVGEMDTELFEEFFRAFAFNAGITLHVTLKAGTNAHHVAEACFKALARSLRMAVETDPRSPDTVPSTKGVLEA